MRVCSAGIAEVRRLFTCTPPSTSAKEWAFFPSVPAPSHTSPSSSPSHCAPPNKVLECEMGCDSLARACPALLYSATPSLSVPFQTRSHICALPPSPPVSNTRATNILCCVLLLVCAPAFPPTSCHSFRLNAISSSSSPSLAPFGSASSLPPSSNRLYFTVKLHLFAPLPLLALPLTPYPLDRTLPLTCSPPLLPSQPSVRVMNHFMDFILI